MSNQTVQCPHCKKEVEISEALKHQIEEQLLAGEREGFEKQMKEMEQRYMKQLEGQKSEFRAAFDKRVAQEKEEAAKKARDEAELGMKRLQEEAEDSKKRSTKLQEEILEMTRQLRAMKVKDEERELEMEKKLAREEEKIKEKARQQVEEEQRLKVAEKDKQLADAIRANEELRRKLQQGSQQTQGEVFELELEEFIAREFPYDEAREVPKGIRGADIIQVVRDSKGRTCGEIVWEIKNTKAWSQSWISKLKEDQRAVTAEIAVLVSSVLPDGIKGFGYVDGIWVCERTAVTGLIMALRQQLIRVAGVKRASEGKQEKAEILYEYLSGTEFRQRIEGMVEAFTQQQDELEKEKRWFALKWSRQEKQIRQVVDQMHGMYGDLQGIMGASLREVEQLELGDGK